MPTDASALLYDVFISYARKDANLGAAPLDSALKRDFRVWRDTRDLPPEQDFTAEIEKAIKAAERLIVCVTPDVEREDSFVRREIAYAQLLKKPLLVARFADVIPPIHVVNHTWIDFFRDWDASLAKLLRWLRGEIVDSAAPAGAATPVPAVDPYRGYVERLYADVVDSLRVSVFSTEAITLRTVESPGDVPRKPAPRINPKFLTTALREPPQPVPTAPAEFASLHEAYASASCAGRVLLLGEPGAGKTTSLLAFARDAAANRLNNPTEPLPVFARISGWDSHAQVPLADWLTAGEEGLKADDLRNFIDTGSALLLLDGLDELGDRRPVDPANPNGEQYDPRERFLKVLPPSGKLILSSRLEDYRQIETQAGLSCAVRLQQLDDSQMEAYLADLPDLWAVVQADKDLKEALRTPLLLALFRIGFEEAPEKARALRDLSAGELNDKIWDVFIDRRWAFEQARTTDYPLTYSVEELKRHLGIAAARAVGDWKVLRPDRTRINKHDISDLASPQVIALALRLNLLIPVGKEPDLVGSIITYREVYRFLHLRLRDALAFRAALARLRDPYPSTRAQAIGALGRLGDVRAVEPLLTTVHDSDRQVVRSSIDALGKLGDVRAFDPLVNALHTRDWGIHSTAITALGNLGDGRAFDHIIADLRNLDDDSRVNAADALGRLSDIRAIPFLIAALQDPVEHVLYSIAKALAKLGDAAIIPLTFALNDPNTDVRRGVAYALGELGDSRAIAALSAALRDPDQRVRRSVGTALGKLGDVGVVALIAALRDPDKYIRRSAVFALQQLSENEQARAALADYRAGKIKPRSDEL